MDDVRCVRCLQGVGDLDGQVEEHLYFQRSSLNGVLQGLTVQKFHGNEGLAIYCVNVVYSADIWMIKG